MSEREDIEVDLLAEAIYRYHGFDFRHYARGSLKRRLLKQVEAEGLATISGLQERILHDDGALSRLLWTLSINVTSMFRDPCFYLALRERALPMLRTYPSLRVWVAGCASGEEVYSIAILLEEAGLYDRATIYATDMNAAVLERAKAATYPLARMREYTRNYQESGAQGSFSDYYTADSDQVAFVPSLRRNVVFDQHNLATDARFNEFQLISCRNVMIYFDRQLQTRVVRLLRDSLCSLGVLGLGLQESLHAGNLDEGFETLDARNRIYRKVGP